MKSKKKQIGESESSAEKEGGGKWCSLLRGLMGEEEEEEEEGAN